jgi:hypothetical protein
VHLPVQDKLGLKISDQKKENCHTEKAEKESRFIWMTPNKEQNISNVEIPWDLKIPRVWGRRKWSKIKEIQTKNLKLNMDNNIKT